MNEAAWYVMAVYYKKRCNLLRLGNGRLCYADNSGVHEAYKSKFEKKSQNVVRFWIKNTTSKSQPVDQEIGVYIQNYIKREFYYIERAYNQSILNGDNPPQRGLGEMRLWVMYKLRDIYYEFKRNRTALVRHSWKTCGLTLALDGSEDVKDERYHLKWKPIEDKQVDAFLDSEDDEEKSED